MAALAVLLIVGGALVAGLLAIRMDSRVPVLVVNKEIAVGTQITEGDLAQVQVASEGLSLVPLEEARQVVIGKYARTTLAPNQLIDRRMLTPDPPIDGDRAMVGVLLTPGLVPEEPLEPGDKVMVVEAGPDTGTTQTGGAITEGLVVGKSRARQDSLGGATTGSVTLLVPVAAVDTVVNAAGNNRAGMALLSRGNSVDDVTLELAE